MGLFTEDKIDYNVPIELRMRESAAKSQRQFTDAYLDPAIKENIGYESPRMKMKALTKGVDLTDGKKVQETFLALQAIDPEQANGWLESIKPVIQQQLNSLKIKSEQLKFTKTKNKPLITQRWNLEGRPNFITEYATTALAGLEGHEDLVAALQTAPSSQKEFVINSFLNKISKDNDGKARIADYKKKLKEANTNYMEFWGGKDLTEKTTEPGTGSKRTVKLKPPPPEADDNSYYKDDPTKNQLTQGFNARRANAKLRSELEDIRMSLYTLIPEFLMTDAELAKENLEDEVGDWMRDETAYDYFSIKGAKALAKFKANPVEYYERVIKKAK